MTTDASCWHCGATEAGSPFCSFCDHLQQPSPDYYEFFGLERKLSLDPEELQKRFYRMSRQFHPDRYMSASPKDRQYSLEATAILNDAYRVLRDPVARAEYILKTEAIEAGDSKVDRVPPDLLEQVFELNEALEEFRNGQQEARPQLESARKECVLIRDESDRELQRLFGEHDRTRDRSALVQIRSVLSKRRYVANLVRQVEAELA